MEKIVFILFCLTALYHHPGYTAHYMPEEDRKAGVNNTAYTVSNKANEMAAFSLDWQGLAKVKPAKKIQLRQRPAPYRRFARVVSMTPLVPQQPPFEPSQSTEDQDNNTSEEEQQMIHVYAQELLGQDTQWLSPTLIGYEER